VTLTIRGGVVNRSALLKILLDHFGTLRNVEEEYPRSTSKVVFRLFIGIMGGQAWTEHPIDLRGGFKCLCQFQSLLRNTL
jgi:hypothetical protein